VHGRHVAPSLLENRPNRGVFLLLAAARSSVMIPGIEGDKNENLTCSFAIVTIPPVCRADKILVGANTFRRGQFTNHYARNAEARGLTGIDAPTIAAERRQIVRTLRP
jgi:hypothetical protein